MTETAQQRHDRILASLPQRGDNYAVVEIKTSADPGAGTAVVYADRVGFWESHRLGKDDDDLFLSTDWDDASENRIIRRFVHDPWVRVDEPPTRSGLRVKWRDDRPGERTTITGTLRINRDEERDIGGTYLTDGGAWYVHEDDQDLLNHDQDLIDALDKLADEVDLHFPGDWPSWDQIIDLVRTYDRDTQP